MNVGAASASFFLTTGRMPTAQPLPYRPPRKEPAYDQADIDALVAYVATLGSGPPVPNVDVADADVPAGQVVIYRANSAGMPPGGRRRRALSYGQYPRRTFHEATPPTGRRSHPDRPRPDAGVLAGGDLGPGTTNNLAAYIGSTCATRTTGAGSISAGPGRCRRAWWRWWSGLVAPSFVSVWIVGRRRHATE